MIGQHPLTYYFYTSFWRDMERLLSEALMWPVLIWLVWVAVARAFGKKAVE